MAATSTRRPVRLSKPGSIKAPRSRIATYDQAAGGVLNLPLNRSGSPSLVVAGAAELNGLLIIEGGKESPSSSGTTFEVLVHYASCCLAVAYLIAIAAQPEFGEPASTGFRCRGLVASLTLNFIEFFFEFLRPFGELLSLA